MFVLNETLFLHIPIYKYKQMLLLNKYILSIFYSGQFHTNPTSGRGGDAGELKIILFTNDLKHNREST
jgi:hypothetical protein